MKVALCFVLVVCTVVAERKAPYLPSGWKPDGPAFLLPSEVQEPADKPLKSTVEVEASGSDFLREYGPPKFSEVSQDISNQALPEIATEQTFAAVNNQEAFESEVKTFEVNKEESVNAEFKTEEVEAAVTNEEVKNGEGDAEEIVAVKGNSESQVEVSVDEIPDAKETEKQAYNIADTLASLEKEVTAQQVQNVQELKEEKTIQQMAGVPAETPAGFLEYGPPKTLEPEGLTEYGPPQEYGSPALRSGSLVEEEESTTTEAASTTELTTSADVSETRRRRFSPKLRPVRRIH